VLAKTTTTQEGAAADATTPIVTTGNQEVEIIADKPEEEEETVKTEPSSALSYMTREQNTKNNNVNPFVTGTEFWQSIMTYWLNAYGEFLKNAPKMTEYWYDSYWKPWLNWMPRPQQQDKDKDRVKIE
jgi:hypothetical protein